MKRIWILTCLLIFSSCSQQRLALRYLDTAAAWKADDYFDLTSNQKDAVKTQLRSFLKNIYENNNKELPRVIDQISNAITNVDDKTRIDCSEIEKIQIKTSKIISEVAGLSIPYVKTLTKTLSKDQVQYFMEVLEEKIKDETKEINELKELENKRFKRTLKNLSLLLGNLSKEQETAVHNHLKKYSFPNAEKLKNKKILYKKLKSIGSDPKDFQKFALDYLQNWNKYQSPQYLKVLNELRSKNEKFYQNFICEASPAQLQFLKNKAISLKKDFEEFFILK